METPNSNNKLIGAGVLAAIVASLCCITPVLAFIAGVSGLASTFSWLEPFRPYLIGITILVLAFAWYQKLRPRTKEEIACACEEDEKPPFWQTKLFLGLVTLFAGLMLAFPYYAHIFYPKTETQIIIVEQSNIETVNFSIDGMFCKACEEHVKHAVAQLPGFIEATANHKTGKSTVKFDKSKTTLEEVTKAINSTGYSVIDKKEQ